MTHPAPFEDHTPDRPGNRRRAPQGPGDQAAAAGQSSASQAGNIQSANSPRSSSSQTSSSPASVLPATGLSDADVRFVQTRQPFCDLDPSAFSKNLPLAKILQTQTQLRRVTPGQVLVRRGDYGNSAMLILAGTVSVLNPSPRGQSGASSIDSLATDSDPPPAKRSLGQRLRDCIITPKHPHTRREDQIRPAAGGKQRIGQTDHQVAMFMQDFAAVMVDGQHAALGPGEMFGEVAAMYRTPHSATVVATEESAVLEITWQGLRELRRDKAFDQNLDDHYRRHWLPLHLRENQLLRFLDDQTIAKIAAASTLRSYGRLRWYADYRKTTKRSPAEQIAEEPVVVREGSFPTDLLIVRSGFGRVSVEHGASVQTTAYLGAGHVFDLESVVRNCLNPSRPQMHQHALRAVGMLDVIAIPIELFADEVLPKIRRGDFPPNVQRLFPSLNRRSSKRKTIGKTISDRRANTDPVIADAPALSSTSLMEFVVGNRLNNGPAAMVIDLDRCTGCDDCMRACATTHGGDSRFKRSGPAHGRLQFASACMQCTDPVCMIGCPTGAITRDADASDPSLTNVVTIDESTCIGCKTCAGSCPYENIDMVNVVNQGGDAFLDIESGKPMLKATKCDLCVDLGGNPQCVAACPHDALVRIDLTHSRPLDQFLKTRIKPRSETETGSATNPPSPELS